MVAATRSQVCTQHGTLLGAPPPRKTGSEAVSVSRGLGGQLSSTEASSNVVNYTCLVSSVAPEAQGVKRKAGRRPGKQNPGYKPRVIYADLPGDDVSIAASRAGKHNEVLDPQNVLRDLGARTEISTPSRRSITPPATLKFGMYAGRVKANPLRYLATVLRSKLQPYDEARNLLDVATEIHDEAKNKHNTTLRRIYDVVNVMEAAGLVERSNGHTKKKSPRTRGTNVCASTSNAATSGSPSGECAKSASDFGPAAFECQDEQIDIPFSSPSQTVLAAKTPNPMDKKATRGSRIRWLDSEAETHEKRCHKQILGRLAEQKIAADLRISEKQLEFECLQEQVRLATELIKHNQSRIIQSDAFESDMYPCTPPPEDLSCSYLNFEDCSPTSAETELTPALTELQEANIAYAIRDQSTMCVSSSSSSSSSISPECDPSMISEEDLNFWCNQSASDVEMNILEANEQYCSSSLPLSISGTAKKALHVPFVILQTDNTTNVDIELDDNLTSKVDIALDNEYKLLDYRELLSSMFPAHGRDGGFRYINAS